jgi:hypothetical protein
MSLGLNESNQSNMDTGYSSLRIIWLAILLGVIVLFLLTRLVQPLVVNGNRTVFRSLAALGFLSFCVSFLLRYKLLKQAIKKHKPELARGAYIIAFAFCEATALFGALAYFITGVQLYYFSFVLSGYGILMHKPQRDYLLAAYGEDKA